VNARDTFRQWPSSGMVITERQESQNTGNLKVFVSKTTKRPKQDIQNEPWSPMPDGWVP
jgi:hypothetical protein